MKRTAFAGLFITAALLASPVFAADDLCATNIQTLKDARTSSSTNLSTDSKAGLAKTETDAIAAQDAHDTKKCIDITTKAISELKNTGSGTDGGAAK